MWKRLDSLEDVVRRSYGDIGCVALDEELSYDTTLNDECVALRSVVSEQSSGVEALTDGAGESTSVIGKEVDVGCRSAAKLFLPGVDRELVVDSNHVDVLNTLGLEFLGLLNVAGNLRRAGTGESRRSVW